MKTDPDFTPQSIQPTPESTGISLLNRPAILIKQIHEVGEWFGFETRNKYQILDQTGASLGFAAEQGGGFLGWVMRQFLGHWRKLEVHFYDNSRREVLIARRPFRFFFQRLEVFTPGGKYLGALQQRFGILTKRFDVEASNAQTLFEVASPFLKFWTFIFKHHEKEVAAVRKKWSGTFSEMFTDRDNFLVEFMDPKMTEAERHLLLAAAIFVDLQYFEKKA